MSTNTVSPRWFRAFKPVTSPRMRLFCFPYGGSGPSIFREWPEHLPADIEVTGILYPGRESRVMEPLIDNIVAMAESLLPAIVPRLKQPFAFFGHSMGALVSFELTRLLSAKHNLAPEHLFMSAAGGPHIPTEEPIHHLPDAEFLQALIQLNGMPQEVLQNTELLEYALPIIRNDFTACAEYRFIDGAAVKCPITAIGGANDPRVGPDHMEQWEQHAPGGFDLHMLPGDHFFIEPQQQKILTLISSALNGKPSAAIAGSS